MGVGVGRGAFAVMNTGATTRVLMIPCSSPVYPKQEVVLQNGAHDSWRISIRKRHLCLDNQRCCTLDRAYPHIITQLATSRQKRIITCTRIAGKWGKPWWNWRGGGIQPHTCAIITNLEPQSGMTSTYVLQQCSLFKSHSNRLYVHVDILYQFMFRIPTNALYYM